MNKRGQSEVITTVLIILLVLAAVFIVYTAVKSMLNTGAGSAQEKQKCLGVDLVVNVADATTDSVSVTRQAGGDSSKGTVVVLVGGSVVNDTCGPIGSLETANCASPGLTANQIVKAGMKFGTTACESTSEEVTAKL